MIDVYSWPTPNGHKVHIMLEECGYRLGKDWLAHPVNIGKGDQFDAAFKNKP
jgi:GST-like protein